MPPSRTRRVGGLARGTAACLVVALPAMAAGCGAFGTEGSPGGPSASVNPSTDPPPPAPTTVDAGGPDAPLRDAAAGCPVTGKAAFDPAFGVGGILSLPGGSPVAALGPAGSLYVALQEDCGGVVRAMALRKVPLDGSGPGTVVRCFGVTNEIPSALAGDPSAGYALASRVISGVYSAHLHRLNPDGSARADDIEQGRYSLPTFAARVPGGAPVDAWGYYVTSSTSADPTTSFLQSAPGVSAQTPDGVPVAGAAYAGALLVAFLKDAGDTGASLSVKRFLTGGSSLVADPSFGAQQAAAPRATLLSVASAALVAEPAFAALAVGHGGSAYPLLLGPGGPRALTPVPAIGAPLLARRCDGSLALAFIEAGGTLVIRRYEAEALDASFRAGRKVTGQLAFLVRAPDESLLVGTTAGEVLRLLP